MVDDAQLLQINIKRCFICSFEVTCEDLVEFRKIDVLGCLMYSFNTAIISEQSCLFVELEALGQEAGVVGI